MFLFSSCVWDFLPFFPITIIPVDVKTGREESSAPPGPFLLVPTLFSLMRGGGSKSHGAILSSLCLSSSHGDAGLSPEMVGFHQCGEGPGICGLGPWCCPIPCSALDTPRGSHPGVRRGRFQIPCFPFHGPTCDTWYRLHLSRKKERCHLVQTASLQCESFVPGLQVCMQIRSGGVYREGVFGPFWDKSKMALKQPSGIIQMVVTSVTRWSV